MQIRYKDVILRDMRESDIEDDIRWSTEETQWALWDAPWETEEELRNFDPDKYWRDAREELLNPTAGHRMSLEIETADGLHIGSVNTYCIDENFVWKKFTGGEDKRSCRWAVGIEINESAYWSSGWGTKALTAYLLYHQQAGYINLYTQTWSGNLRMVKLAEKLGFRECSRMAGARQVRGESYDGVTLQLNWEAFATYLALDGGEKLSIIDFPPA